LCQILWKQCSWNKVKILLFTVLTFLASLCNNIIQNWQRCYLKKHYYTYKSRIIYRIHLKTKNHKMLCGPVFLNLLGSKSQKCSVTVQVKKNLIVNIMAVPFGNLYKSLVKTRYDTGYGRTYETGLWFTKLLKQSCKIVCNFKVLLRIVIHRK